MARKSQQFFVGQNIVCVDAMSSGKGLTQGKIYTVVERPSGRNDNIDFVWVTSDHGSRSEFYSNRFIGSDDPTVFRPHVIVRTVDPPRHIGPYESDREAETAAANAFPDGHWVVFELIPKT